MERTTETEIAALRQIGWDFWDPIGIRSPDSDDWRGPAADEYDAYMLSVAAQLRGGVSEEQAANYLDQIASDYIGLGTGTAEAHAASVRTVAAIAEYLRGQSPRGM